MTLTVVDVPAPREPAVHVVGAPALLPQAAPARRRPAPRHARPAPRSSWLDHLLTLAALLGVLTVAVTVTAARSGLRPLVVKSGSMEPTIATGAMVLVRDVPAADIRVGDVVAVERPDRTRVTHRVLSVRHHGRTAELVLKGDANPDPDPAPVAVTHGGRLVLSTPWLGRVGAFLSSARGGFVLGWLVASVMLAVLRRKKASCVGSS